MILPVSCSIDLDFDCEKVWQIISEPGNLNKTHPFCKSNKIVNWDKNKYKLEYGAKKVDEGFEYISSMNKHFLSVEELRNIIDKVVSYD